MWAIYPRLWFNVWSHHHMPHNHTHTHTEKQARSAKTLLKNKNYMSFPGLPNRGPNMQYEVWSWFSAVLVSPHWNPRAVMMPTLSSLVAPEVAVTTARGAANETKLALQLLSVFSPNPDPKPIAPSISFPNLQVQPTHVVLSKRKFLRRPSFMIISTHFQISPRWHRRPHRFHYIHDAGRHWHVSRYTSRWRPLQPG